jgi:hypothetical protein
MIHRNWDFLGKSQTTEFLHKKRLMCGYRRPKNLRDILVKANVPVKPGDEQADPQHSLLTPIVVATPSTPTLNTKSKQKSISDFFKPSIKGNDQTQDPIPSTSGSSMNPPGPQSTQLIAKPKPGPSKFRGFNFCNRKECRYCPLLNKTGKITCHVTGLEHNCMKNISCRSSNLIYAISCTRCGIQYVGQTMLRLKDRFVHHFRDITISDQEKTVSKHFSQGSHCGIDDVNISILEFIKKPPRSPQAASIRNRVEKHWTHLLRCMAPHGLNIENPKEYTTKINQ